MIDISIDSLNEYIYMMPNLLLNIYEIILVESEVFDFSYISC